MNEKNGNLGLFRQLAAELDGLGIACCIFDNNECCLGWNRTFLAFFPEHEGHVFVGEHYSENLRRFYGFRLGPAELDKLEMYVQAGIERHRAQSRTYSFDHRGRKLRVAALSLDGGWSVRLWRADTPALHDSPVPVLQVLPQTGRLPDSVTSCTSILDRMPDGVMISGPDGCIEWVNESFVHMYQLASRTIVPGLPFESVYRQAWANSVNHHPEALYDGLKLLDEHLRFSGAPFELELPNNRFVRIIARPGQDGTVFFAHVDITEIKRQQRLLHEAERSAHHAATHDSLTGLMNRRKFMQVLEFECAQHSRADRPFAVLFLDLDGFKPINDQFGHAVGDQALEWVSGVLSCNVRETDSLARLGGDEFVVLLRHAGDIETVRVLTHRIIDSLNQPFCVDGHDVSLGVSIGIALYPQHGTEPDTLLQVADQAMYLAKKQGGGCAHLLQVDRI